MEEGCRRDVRCQHRDCVMGGAGVSLQKVQGCFDLGMFILTETSLASNVHTGLQGYMDGTLKMCLLALWNMVSETRDK